MSRCNALQKDSHALNFSHFVQLELQISAHIVGILRDSTTSSRTKTLNLHPELEW